MPRHPLFVLAAALAASCATAHAPVPPPAPAPPAAAARVLPDSVHWLRNSAEYKAIALQTYALATRRLEAAAAGKTAGAWAVIVDADETLLDNSQYQKERELQGLGFTAESWRGWVARRAAPAVPGGREYLLRVRALGGRIAVVTNRTVAECPDSEANFQALGLVYDVMLCKPDGGKSDKEGRFAQLAAGEGTGLPPLELLMFVGDNILDFPGLSQGLRTKPREAFALFGDRYFVLPNPMYGSWEKNPRE